MAGAPTATAPAGTADDAIFARMVRSTQEALLQPVATDTWLTMTDKMLKKAKLEKPLSITSFNAKLLEHPEYYLLLLVEEKGTALQNVQHFLRSFSKGERPHLCEELCSLVYALSNVLMLVSAVAPPLTPLAIFQAVEPILHVLRDKIEYIRGRASEKPAKAATRDDSPDRRRTRRR